MSNSSLMVKDEEGNQQRMIVLQKPIPLNQLAIEHEEKDVKKNENVTEAHIEFVCFDDIVTSKKLFTVSTNVIQNSANDDEEYLLLVEDAIESDDENPIETCSKPKVSKKIKDELKKEKFIKNYTYLKEPIPLHTLQCIEEGPKKYQVNKKRKEAPKQNKVNKKRKEAPKPDVPAKQKIENKTKMVILKKPIPLDSLQCDMKEDEFPFTVKLIRSIKSIRSEEQNSKEFHRWQQNALTIFEFSHVYPFIHAISKYKCIVCYKLFLEAHLLKLHIENEHGIADLKEKLTLQVKDKNLKVDITSLQCKICSATLTNFNELKVHLKNHGKDIDVGFKDNIIPFKLNEKQFDCQMCTATYSKLRSLVRHMNSNHFNDFSCEYCGSQFGSLRLLKNHLQSHEGGSFPCPKCDKVFKSAVNRSNHIRVTHLKHLLRTCPYCPERFSSNYNRTKHIRIAHKPNTQLFRCETCGKGFDLKYHLHLHIRSVHLHERNYECKVCHLRFFNNYAVSRHMSIHTGDYQFKCQICGKGFATRIRYKEHCKTHNVVCYTCGASCKNHDCLTAHVKDVHGGG